MRCHKSVTLTTLPAVAAIAMTILASPAANAVTTLDFSWEGQIAGFSIEGVFSYDETIPLVDGVVRKDDLLSFDVSFFDPDGNLLRTYEDNHLTYDLFNFNYDTTTMMILQDGVFSAPDGIDIGEYVSDGAGGFVGLNFWSKPNPNAVAHVHFDDWSDEFGFPRGFSGHEDVAFFTRTTQQLLDSGGVGPTYEADPNFAPDEFGEPMSIVAVPLPSTMVLLGGGLAFGGLAWRVRQRHGANS